MRHSRLAVLTLVGLLAGGLAQAQPTQPTTGTNTTIKQIEEPPYYGGKLKGSGSSVAFLPVTVAPVAAGLPDNWVPTAELELLADDITAWIAGELDRTLVESWSPGERSVAPHVYFGCSFYEIACECILSERQNVLATTTGTRSWRSDVTAALADHPSVDRLIVLEVGLAPQWIRQRNLAGKKEIRLGTGYTQPLPWLSSLDTPIWVLQVRGVVVDGEGRILRSGAEGVWALRTPFRDSAMGGQQIMSPADVERVRTAHRRDELPGQPLAWQVAAHQLLHQLGASTALPRASGGELETAPSETSD